ncbi:MAG: hypothetical protein EBZ36_18125, partial [Acidobacteria bacterium]|nr:hypothetical protein [Acidobacteriota bacterium]
ISPFPRTVPAPNVRQAPTLLAGSVRTVLLQDSGCSLPTQVPSDLFGAQANVSLPAVMPPTGFNFQTGLILIPPGISPLGSSGLPYPTPGPATLLTSSQKTDGQILIN